MVWNIDEDAGRYSTIPVQYIETKKQKRDRLKAKILDVIKQHKGKRNPINIHHLLIEIRDKDATNYEARCYSGNAQIRDMIDELIEVDGEPVLSTIKKPRGYYYAATKEDFDEFTDMMNMKISGIQRHIDAAIMIKNRLFP